jgi:ribosomal protein S12 methylthiotransferase accessory factor YcaO
LELHYPKSVVFREEPGGGILFDVDTGNMRFVEGVALGICWMISKHSSREQILDDLVSRYPETGRAALEKDMEAFLVELEQSGMLGI